MWFCVGGHVVLVGVGGGMSQSGSVCNNVENKLCGIRRQKWEAIMNMDIM